MGEVGANTAGTAGLQPGGVHGPDVLGMDAGAGDYAIPLSEVLRYLGHTNQQLDEALESRIREGMARCREASKPSWAWRIHRVCDNGQHLTLGGSDVTLEGASIRTHLEGARYCAVTIATCGLSNERELQRLSALGGLDALVFDAAGSALAEVAADACNASVVAFAHQHGLFCNWRYGPGYGDLPLALQPQIVRLLDADKRFGVTGTAGGFLVPAKTVTGLIGLFDTPQDDKRSCVGCSFAPHCTLREKGAACYR